MLKRPWGDVELDWLETRAPIDSVCHLYSSKHFWLGHCVAPARFVYFSTPVPQHCVEQTVRSIRPGAF
jgi:hypothetical protein